MAATSLTQLKAPVEVVRALERLRDQLVAAAGRNLKALLVYGSVARGRYRPGKSDVNVALVLREASPDALSALSGPIRQAWRAVRVEPLILMESETGAFAAAFPGKLLEIQKHFVVLAGEGDPFGGVAVNSAYLRRHLRQQLQNLGLWLRKRYVFASGDSAAIGRVLARAARPLAVNLADTLRVLGKPLAKEETTEQMLLDAADTWKLDGASLARLAALRRGGFSGNDLPGLYSVIVGIIDRALEFLEQEG